MEFLFSLLVSFALASSEVPSAHAFLGWSNHTDREAITLDKIEKVEIKCGTKLFPAYPQSYLKQYHEVLIGSYDHAKMTAKDDACAIAGNGPVRHCLRPKLIYSYILSDTFNDSCGNLYRGVWRVVFFDSDESMGTLISKGRTLYEDPKAELPGTYVYGPTYACDVSEFIYLGRPFPGDSVKTP